jgi:hypothetical protein
MAETEVETILREIRERVLAEQRAGQNATVPLDAGGSPTVREGSIKDGSNSSNGASASGPTAMARTGDSEPAQNLSLINSYLTTTARAWDRLPPLVSNRSGFSARVELWLKRQLKRATRWYAWEQVNFNAAVHHTLRDLLPVLAAQDTELRNLRAQLARQAERDQELATQLAELQTSIIAQVAADETQRNQVAAQLAAQLDAKFAAVVSELREREDRLLEEQRVCYKQLALEATEAAVLEDRARRKTETLVEELRRRLEQLEAGK